MTANNEQWEICFVGTAGKCDAELDWSMDWSMDLADGAGNGSVGKPRIKAMRTVQNLPQSAGQPTFCRALAYNQRLRYDNGTGYSVLNRDH